MPGHTVPIDAVLAATDFSVTGDAAVAHAYAVVRPGGTVHLLHVIELLEPRKIPNPLYAHYVPGRAPTAEERQREMRAAERRLEELAPAEALLRRIQTTSQAIEAPDIARAILDAATRARATMICVGSRRRWVLAKLLGASVVRKLLRRSPITLLVVRAARQVAGSR